MNETDCAPLRARLTDEQLADMNAAHRWRQWFRDADGRVVGAGDCHCVHAWKDERVASFLHHFAAAGKRVLEPASFEGLMTCALCAAGADVTAFDARSTCAAKTHARTAAFGFFPRVLVCNADEMAELGEFDAVFHSGLLYHLGGPAAHLGALARLTPFVGLHTHAWDPADDAECAVHEGYRGRWRDEGGWQNELEGAAPRAFWPTRTELARMIADAGFSRQTVFERPLDRDVWTVFYLLRKRDG